MHFDIQHLTKVFTEASASREDFSTRARAQHGISPIEIDIEILTIPQTSGPHTVMQRPVAVRGVVFPISTQERKVTPDPIAFHSLAHYIQSTTRRRVFRSLTPHSDRGHIFALELGGPQSSYNIMPQWGGFQENGDWRRLEKQIRENALKLAPCHNSVFLEFNIEYLNLDMRHYQEILKSIFLFQDTEDHLEEKAKKCLHVFGIPTAYSFHSHPCNLYIKKPRQHALSIAYIRYLENISQRVWNDQTADPLSKKIKTAQKSVGEPWGPKTLQSTQLLNHDPQLAKDHVKNFCVSGRFDLSEMTEADLWRDTLI